MQLEGKVIIVTGGASGIGGAISRVLLRRGAKVVAVDLNAEAGAKLKEEAGDSLAFIAGDVSKQETADAAVAAAVENFGGLNGLVNNAHASRQAPFTDLDQAAWDLSFNTGFLATRQFMLAAYPHLKDNVTANEWAANNIRVNVVSPMALTDGVKAWSQAFPDLYEQSLTKVPLGRFGDPETDVAPVVAFLLSDDAKYVTGQTLMADGGANKLY